MSTSHAAIGSPSALPLIVQCPGSVALSADLPPQPDTQEILEGNVADWVACEYQRKKLMDPGRVSPIKGGPLVDDEMIRGALLFRDTAQRYGGAAAVPQIPVSCAPVHPMSWGTPDLQWWDGTWLTNIDYKYGHALHDPYEHYQSIAYAAGGLNQLDLLGKPEIPVRIVIVQPRDYANKVKVWELNVGELRAYINIAAAAVEESQQPNARTRTGPRCLNCRARYNCQTLREATASIVEHVARSEVQLMTAEAKGQELEALHDAAVLIKARITGLEQQALADWFNGNRTPGWYAKQGEGRLAWNRSTSEVRRNLLASHQIDVIKTEEPQLITPTQAINDRGIPESVIKQYSSRSAGEWQLHRDDGKDVKKRFKGVKFK